MGCFCSRLFDDLPEHVVRSKRLKRPLWKSEEPYTEAELQVGPRTVLVEPELCTFASVVMKFVSVH